VHFQCTAGQRVERFNGRIEEVLQSHQFRSGEELETTLHRYVWLYNQQLPQSALGSKVPLQAMKEGRELKPELVKKHPYYLPGCDSNASRIVVNSGLPLRRWVCRCRNLRSDCQRRAAPQAGRRTWRDGIMLPGIGRRTTKAAIPASDHNGC
jgi:hypothetical protein